MILAFGSFYSSIRSQSLVKFSFEFLGARERQKWAHRSPSLFRLQDCPTFQLFLPTPGDQFLHIGTNNTSTLLGDDNTTHTNHLATAFVIKGFRRFEWKGITVEQSTHSSCGSSVHPDNSGGGGSVGAAAAAALAVVTVASCSSVEDALVVSLTCRYYWWW